MDKCVLEQYTEMQQEEKDLRRRIQNLAIQLENLEKKGYVVADSVSCGKKGKKSLGTCVVQGFPFPAYERKKSQLRRYKRQLEAADERLLKLLTETEEYINNITDSRIRRIFRYRYVDNLSWIQVAHRMGGKHTPDSCRKTHDRFIEEN